VIAGAAYQIVQTGALAAEDQHQVAGQVELAVIGGAAFIEPANPEVVALQLFESADEVDHAGDAQVLGRASAGLDRGRGERGGAALGDEDPVDAGAIGHAQQRTKILRILDAVERENQARGAGSCNFGPRGVRREEVFEGQQLLRADERDDALVRVGTGHLRELLAGLEGDPNTGLAALSEQSFEARIAALARGQHAVKAAFPGAQSFFDRMQAVENVHKISVVGRRGLALPQRFLNAVELDNMAAPEPMSPTRKKTFTARLEPDGTALKWVIARVPFDIEKAWPERRRLRVRGEIVSQKSKTRGFPFRTSLFPARDGKGHVVLVNKKMQRAVGARQGDTVRMVLEPDFEERPAVMPKELERALRSDRQLRKWFDGLTEYMRRTFCAMVSENRSAAAQARMAERIAERLLLAMEGEKETPPILRAAFTRQPLAEAGWKAMTATQRRNALLAIFYYESPEARERRAAKVVDEALKRARVRREDPGD
jgi:hypothetical protein